MLSMVRNWAPLPNRPFSVGDVKAEFSLNIMHKNILSVAVIELF